MDYSCPRIGPLAQYIFRYAFLGLSLLQKPLEILLSGSSRRKEDFDVTVVALCSSYTTSDYEDAFSTAQGMLLMLRYSRRAFIKILHLPVPHVLRHDVHPIVEDFAGA